RSLGWAYSPPAQPPIFIGQRLLLHDSLYNCICHLPRWLLRQLERWLRCNNLLTGSHGAHGKNTNAAVIIRAGILDKVVAAYAALFPAACSSAAVCRSGRTPCHVNDLRQG